MLKKIFKVLFGNRRVSNQRPVIVVPGLFGSLGKDIIPGTGKFGFGPANKIYKPLIDGLIDMGYQKNKNLFVAHYNWRNKNSVSAKESLIPIINKAKQACNSSKVDLVCHSMGGLVARSYIQSKNYRYDVDKLIMIGTPNLGSVKAYCYWQGGVLPYEEAYENFLYKALWRGYIWILKIYYREDDTLKVLHKYCPSIKELLPSKDYGNYLFYEINNRKIYKSIDSLKIKNDFLNSLNSNIKKLYYKKIKLYNIVGYGVDTYDKICVKNAGNKDLWLDGKPVYFTFNSGDGTVTLKSSKFVKGTDYFINKDHTDIVEFSINPLSKILNKKIAKIKSTSSKKIRINSIMVSNCKDILVILNGKRFTLEKFKDVYNEYIEFIKFENNIWIIIDSKFDDNIKLIIKPLNNKGSKIIRFDEKISTLGNNEKIIVTNKVYVLNI